MTCPSRNKCLACQTHHKLGASSQGRALVDAVQATMLANITRDARREHNDAKRFGLAVDARRPHAVLGGRGGCALDARAPAVFTSTRCPRPSAGDTA